MSAPAYGIPRHRPTTTTNAAQPEHLRMFRIRLTVNYFVDVLGNDQCSTFKPQDERNATPLVHNGQAIGSRRNASTERPTRIAPNFVSFVSVRIDRFLTVCFDWTKIGDEITA